VVFQIKDVGLRMLIFILSQIIGLILFVTLNYGIISYIQYRKNQCDNNAEKKVEWFFLQNARVGLYIFLVFGVFNRVSTINENLNIDYTYVIFRTIFSGGEITLLSL